MSYYTTRKSKLRIKHNGREQSAFTVTIGAAQTRRPPILTSAYSRARTPFQVVAAMKLHARSATPARRKKSAYWNEGMCSMRSRREGARPARRSSARAATPRAVLSSGSDLGIPVGPAPSRKANLLFEKRGGRSTASGSQLTVSTLCFRSK